MPTADETQKSAKQPVTDANGAGVNMDPFRDQALASLDVVRKWVAAGEVCAFVVVALTPEDALRVMPGYSRPVSVLRLEGALVHAIGEIQKRGGAL